MKKGNSNQKKDRLRDRKELTVSEMVLIISIIVILIVVIEPNLQNFLRTAKQTKADVSAKKLYTAAAAYLNDKHIKGDTVSFKSDVWKHEYYNGTVTENAPLREIMENYFKGGEIDYDVSYEIRFDEDGHIKLVIWKEDGFTGSYPKKNRKK